MEWFQPTGPKARAPLIFGKYEIARTSDGRNRPSAAFRDRGRKESKLELTGDPGAYDPWSYDDLHRMYGSSKKRASFDSTAPRDMNMQ